MAKPNFIELDDGRSRTRLPILYEDRSVIAIDKPAGWMLVPFTWQRTNRNLQAAVVSSIAARNFWARSRDLKFLRHVHRLDADTTGVLLFAKSPGAVRAYGDLFESRRMEKVYWAVVEGTPAERRWVCRKKLSPDPKSIGRMVVDERSGKPAETEFRVLEKIGPWCLLEARPYTGRTHQIRVHLEAAGCPVVGDDLYGTEAPAGSKPRPPRSKEFPLGLRAIELAYVDPFTRRTVCIQAATERFRCAFGCAGSPGHPQVRIV